MSRERVPVRLLFVDDGSYHHEVVRVPGSSLEGYDRLIDALREDPALLSRLHVDVGRLCAAYRVEEGEEGEEGEEEEAGADAGSPGTR